MEQISFVHLMPQYTVSSLLNMYIYISGPEEMGKMDVIQMVWIDIKCKRVNAVRFFRG